MTHISEASDPPMIAFMRDITVNGPRAMCLTCGDTACGFAVAEAPTVGVVEDGERLEVVPCPCGEGSLVLVDAWTASTVVQVYDAFKKEESRTKFGALPLLKLVDITWKLVG